MGINFNPAAAFQNVQRNVGNTIQNAQKSVSNTAQSVQRNVSNTVQAVQKNVSSTGQNIQRNVGTVQRNVGNTVQAAQKNVSDTAQGIQRNVKNTIRGAQKNVSNAAQGIQRNVTNTMQGAQKNANNTAQGIQRNVGTIQRNVSQNLRNTQKLVSQKTDSLQKQFNSGLEGKTGYERFSARMNNVLNVSEKVGDKLAHFNQQGGLPKPGTRNINVAGEAIKTATDLSKGVGSLINGTPKWASSAADLVSGKEKFSKREAAAAVFRSVSKLGYGIVTGTGDMAAKVIAPGGGRDVYSNAVKGVQKTLSDSYEKDAKKFGIDPDSKTSKTVEQFTDVAGIVATTILPGMKKAPASTPKATPSAAQTTVNMVRGKDGVFRADFGQPKINNGTSSSISATSKNVSPGTTTQKALPGSSPFTQKTLAPQRVISGDLSKPRLPVVTTNGDGFTEVRVSQTSLPRQSKVNTEDNLGSGTFRPSEASAAVQVEPVLGGTVKRYESNNSGSNKTPDFIIASGKNKGKTVDMMYTTAKYKPGETIIQKGKKGQPDREIEKKGEIQGLNDGFTSQMTKPSSKTNNIPPGKDQIEKHLQKADIVVMDFRTLTPQNQKLVTDYLKDLPKSKRDQVIILR